MTLFEGLYLLTLWAGLFLFYLSLGRDSVKYLTAKGKKSKAPTKSVDISTFETPLNTIKSSKVEESSMSSEEIKQAQPISELAEKLKKSRNR